MRTLVFLGWMCSGLVFHLRTHLLPATSAPIHKTIISESFSQEENTKKL